jgi:hypothetical protein
MKTNVIGPGTTVPPESKHFLQIRVAQGTGGQHEKVDCHYGDSNGTCAAGRARSGACRRCSVRCFVGRCRVRTCWGRSRRCGRLHNRTRYCKFVGGEAIQKALSQAVCETLEALKASFSHTLCLLLSQLSRKAASRQPIAEPAADYCAPQGPSRVTSVVTLPGDRTRAPFVHDPEAFESENEFRLPRRGFCRRVEAS